jgi:hypothetical protein
MIFRALFAAKCALTVAAEMVSGKTTAPGFSHRFADPDFKASAVRATPAVGGCSPPRTC